MKPFIQITFSTGQTYQFPTHVIAANRAKAMLESHPDEFANLDAAMADTVGLFDDSAEIREWALNNMNPDDYMPYAQMVRFVSPERDFNSADWSYHDDSASVGEIEAEHIMSAPLEAIATSMAEARQLCNVSLLNDIDGKPFAAIAVIIGHESVLKPYLNTLTDLTNQIMTVMSQQQAQPQEPQDQIQESQP